MPDSNTQTVLHTLERGLTLLEAVATADGTATAKVLSRKLDIKIGTCYHLLRTLLATGHVVRLPGGRYDVGPRAASLSRHLQQRSGPSPELAAILTRLHNKTQETSYLSGWYHGTLTLQHYLSGLHAVSVGNLDVGYTGHMHARASCKAVLAFLPHEQVAAMFDGVELAPVTSHTITDYDRFVAELARVRKQGYALDLEEFCEGVSCVAAPFYDASGSPFGAFTVSVPADRFRERRLWLTTEVREAASIATGLLRTGRLTVPQAARA
ncbi:IclR family transcriptional regulator [Nonomuraea sp. NEAU-A123]|uniref:IclR family transcriptional regulator n=1 Tax=Nonomuraea sp. NEAU-A123 TaxID=2839649 RepID=UPI001BE4BC2A|nr:IclR family transcriptional regulator [Nonomuraea sp. NEAU-A123]MBT2224724.1 IclR family transcriptional regulator [Nonomuraea sp. NEAU-A123]